MIIVQRYQQTVANCTPVEPSAGTISVTNVRAEQSDQDPLFLSKTKTITETRREDHDHDAGIGGGSAVFPR